MKIKTAEFLISSADYKGCPDTELPEFAFIGRSNVGKSSLINMLMGNKSLAKTSGTPGKTQLINHFIVNEKWYLVDLPGYGYAKVSKNQRDKFQKIISDYLLKRTSLTLVFVLLDSRLDPQMIDLEFINWCGENHVPFAMVFTKIDKLSSAELNRNLAKYNKELLKTWEEIPPVFTTSATSASGKEPVLNYITAVLTQH
jgi:GTP-binding protein